ncbi:MAG TPA: IS4 family transposase [Aggregicoccus sp.]|nr:IS4 family transposase [Aggregicoccus sp.]
MDETTRLSEAAARAEAEATYGQVDLGHGARTTRLVQMMAGLAQRPAGRVTQVFTQDAQRQGAFGFLESRRVREEDVAQAVSLTAAERVLGLEAVVVPMDQSSLHLGGAHGCPRGLGPIGKQQGVGGAAQGLQVMTGLALREDGTPLGVLAQDYWAREASGRRRHSTHDARPFESRESAHWLLVLEACLCALAAAGFTGDVRMQVDRGGDGWRLLSWMAASAHLVHVTVRAAQNRRLADGGKLFARLQRAPVLGQRTLQLPRRGPFHPARWARLQLRACPVRLLLRDRVSARTQTACLWALEAREVGRCPRGARRLHWRLLSNSPVHTFEQAARLLDDYTLRWRVEDFHKTWKSVCRVEDSELRSRPALEKWARLLAANAMRIERLKHLARTEPQADATRELAQDEVDTLLLLHRPDAYRQGARTLRMDEAVELIARMGGYTGKSSGGPPGSITLARGLERLDANVETYRAMQQLKNLTNA